MKDYTVRQMLRGDIQIDREELPEVGMLAHPIWVASLTARNGRPRRLAAVPGDGSCLVWQGADNGNNHAMYCGSPAYRQYWEFFYGPIPAGHEVHHTCGNGMCVNPLHMQVVTPLEHLQLTKACRRKRGRKLNMESVAEIKALIGKGLRHKEIAELYGIAVSYVSLLKLGLRWPEVQPTG
jgi:hypothetical protein